MLQCWRIPPRSFLVRRGRALMGGGSPSPFPPSAAARVRRGQPFGGGGLSSVSPPSVSSCTALSLRGVSSPPSPYGRPDLWVVAQWPSSPDAGPTLAWPLADSFNATLPYSRRMCLPFSVVAPAAPAKCLGGYPALPATAAVSIASSVSSNPPCRAMPSPPSGACSLVAQAVGGFSSPPPLPPSVLPPSVVGSCDGSQCFVSPGSLCPS